MTRYGYNAKYLTKNEKPWFPIMGEIHYSRVPRNEWDEYLYKMKTSNVFVVSTYCIWIHHEEIEGRYDFEGNKDVREFLNRCKNANLKVFLRIGPWCHGEVRNGGFPDWLLKKPFPLRENNEMYFETVHEFYAKIYEQVDGMLFKQGGPIIGIQIENEYGHAGGLTGEAGEEHMKRLTLIAKEVGFDVPYYTATGWGGAITAGLIPVMGGYCDAPWDARMTEIEPSGNFIFTHERNDHNIGSDYGLGHGITFDINAFPFLTAELGGGLQVTKHRRPRVTSKDIGAMSLAKLGSGVNLLGYYMYAGGTNPVGILSTLQESRDTGYPNDLPELSYDFQAPIGEYGQISDSYREIKLLTLFLRDFGEMLCDMPAIIPEENPNTPFDMTNLRYSYRHNGESGFVFINNYQRHQIMKEHKKVKLSIQLEKELLPLPDFDVKNEEFFFLPFNMKVGGATLKTALATPLCILNNKSFVFYTDKNPSYMIEGDLEDKEIITISREEAKHAWKILGEQEYLIISEDTVIQTNDSIEVIFHGKAKLLVYPEINKGVNGFEKVGKQGIFTIYESVESNSIVDVKHCFEGKDDKKTTYTIEISYEDDAMDYFLRLDYLGESAKLYIDGKMVADHFYYGDAWKIGLRRLGFPKSVTLEVYLLTKDTKVYLESWPDMGEEGIMHLQKVEVEQQRRQSFLLR